MKLFLFCLFSLNIFGQPLDEKFYEDRRKVKILQDYLGSIQLRYWNVLLKLSGEDVENRDLLSKYNYILAIEQRYSDDCNKKVNFGCENIYFEMLDSLSEIYKKLLGLKNRKPNLEFETQKVILKIQLYFVEHEIKKGNMSVHDRYRIVEELKTYGRLFFNNVNQNCPPELKDSLYDFWKNFIMQSHFLLAKDSNLSFFIKNFDLMNKTFYNFVYTIQNIDKLEKTIDLEIQNMNSQWNFIQKNLYNYEKSE